MINQYIIKVRIDGHYTERDVNCPPGWRGSGCYDRDVKTWKYAEVEVWARNAQEAEEFAEEYDYQAMQEDCLEIDGVRIVNIALARILYDRGEDEAGVIEPVSYGN